MNTHRRINMSSVATSGKRLSKNDEHEASRLYKEAHTALEAIAVIIARTLGVQLDGNHKVMFAPSDHASTSSGTWENKVLTFKGIEIFCSSSGCGCYDNNTQECFPC
jgi:hypothetical protein